MTRRERERLRESFKPKRIRLLFIGESPPASGRFFYSSNSGLYRAMREALFLAYPASVDNDFFAEFRARGCYLTDLSKDPVDDLEPTPRRAACEAGERELANEIRKLNPGGIAILLRSIAGNCDRAIAAAKWHGPIVQLRYPGRWASHRKAFLEAVVPVLRKLD